MYRGRNSLYWTVRDHLYPIGAGPTNMDRQTVEDIIETIGISDHGQNSIVLYHDEPYRIVAFGKETIILNHLFSETLVSNRFPTYTEVLEAAENGEFVRARVTPVESPG